ncbi:MAG: HAMP domain-containing sensor histidine kinase [Candidatus Solibacter sp.]|nr:HAMP domain-containing sensor histidine kinase [Candidatus Solibacter sp.]
MRWAQIHDWLLPPLTRDEGFRQEMLSASFRGIWVVVAMEAVVAIIGFTGQMPRNAAFGLLLSAAATFGAASLGATYPHNRILAGVSACAACVISVRSMASGASMDYALGSVTSVVLSTVTAVPLLPVQSFCLGGIVVAAGLDSGHLFFFVMLALVATAISATLMAQRSRYYRLYLDTLRTSGELREFQSKEMRAESSGTMIRMTAALAHELSSPIGALSSGIETLLSVCGKQAQAAGPGQERLLGVLSDLRGSLQDSLERLRKMVNRIQRLTNLDEAVLQEANLNELVAEAVGLMKPHSPEGTRFDLHLQPVPNVTCQPQRLISVLCSLLANSFQALSGSGRIAVSTTMRDSRLELKIEDNGRGIPAERLAHIFDPRFQVADGRVLTGNWSLFTSRQCMIEHGGDIRIQSTEGKGTTVCLTLRIPS